VLVVEDHPHQLRTLTELLEAEGIEAIGVSTGTEALAALEREEVGIVVVDLHLPDRNGTALLEQLRAKSETTRIIIHTGNGSFTTAKDAVNLGAFAYIEKGEDPQELIRHVHRAREANLARYATSLEAAVAQRTTELTRQLVQLETLHDLVSRLNSAESLDEIYGVAMEALGRTLQPDRASILLFDPDGVMRFKAWRGLSDSYRQAVEGHSPWKPDTTDAQLILISDAAEDARMGPYRSTFLKEGIRALAFIPLLAQERVIGKFMVYYDRPHPFGDEEVRLAETIAAHVAFAVMRKQAEDGLQAERRLFFAGPSVAFKWRAQEGWPVEYVSPNVKQQFGYAPEEFTSGRLPYARIVHPGDLDRVATEMMAHSQARVPFFEQEYRIAHADGQYRWLYSFTVVARDPRGTSMHYHGYIQDITERKRAEEALRRSYEEREWISQDLHDGVLQSIYAIGLGLEAMKRDIDSASPAMVHRLDDVIGQLNALIQEVRSFITREPVPGGEVQDPMRSLQSVIGSFTAMGAGEIAVQLDPSVAASFSVEQHAHLVHIVKEALSNSVRHAHAAHRSVTLGRSRDGIRLEILDDGVGFRVNQHRETGMGLSTMRARAKKLGGCLSVISRPGRGTRVILTLPPLVLLERG
jgi:PAS domain S-box-containing protein